MPNRKHSYTIQGFRIHPKWEWCKGLTNQATTQTVSQSVRQPNDQHGMDEWLNMCMWQIIFHHMQMIRTLGNGDTRPPKLSPVCPYRHPREPRHPVSQPTKQISIHWQQIKPQNVKTKVGIIRLDSGPSKKQKAKENPMSSMWGKWEKKYRGF